MTRLTPRAQAASFAGLLLLAAGFGTVIYRELDQPPAEAAVAAAAPAAPPQAPQAEANFTLAPISSFDEIVARPLLSPTRRPPPAQAAGKDTTLTVAGIVISPKLKSAVIAHGTPPVVTRVEEGQEIEGWTVQTIGSDHVVLARGGSEQALKLIDKHVAAKPNGARPPRPTPPASGDD